MNLITRYTTYIFVFASLLLMSCEVESCEEIASVEPLIEVDADSAIVVLNQIRGEELSQYDDALSRVLLTRAQLKVDSKFMDVELITPSFDYFQNNGTPKEQILAAYCYARVKRNVSCVKEATQIYLSTLEVIEVETSSEYFLRLKAAMISELASIYFEQGYKEEAQECYNRSAEIYEELGDEVSTIYLRFMVAVSMTESRDRVESIAVLNRLGESYKDSDLKLFLDLAILTFASSADIYPLERMLEMWSSIDYGAVEQLSSSNVVGEWSESPRFMYNTISAILLYRSGEFEGAYQHIKLGIGQISKITALNVGYYASAAEIASVAGEVGAALDYQRIYSSKLDSIHVATREHQIKQVKAEYHRQSVDELRITRIRYQLYLLGVFSLLLVGSIVWGVRAHRLRVQKRDEQIANYLAMIESYKQTTNNFTEQLRDSDERERVVKNYLSSRRDMVQQIAQTYYVYGESSRFAEKMCSLALSDEMLGDIVRMTDLYNDGVIGHLRSEMNGWTERNYNFAALVIAGFSAQEISVMLGMSLGGVYTLKSKLKRKVLEAAESGESKFAHYFS